MAGQANFVIQPYLTAIALAYSNERMIADDVLPRTTVDRQVFKYNAYNQADTFTVPSTYVGRLSEVNEVDWSATESTSQTRDYGLEHPIPASDLLNVEGNPMTPIDPRTRSVVQLTDLIALDREIRTANLVFNDANYPAANKQTLTSNGAGSTRYQWNDYTNSDPIYDIMTALDGVLMRPNVLLLGRAVFTKLVSHPKIIKAFYGNPGDSGVATREFIKQLFELDDVLVGEGWVNSAKKGQTPSMARVWGKHAVLMYRNPLTQGDNGAGAITFGQTFQFGQRIAGTVENDPDIGLRGGTRVRVGESVKELILASDTGYMFKNAVA